MVARPVQELSSHFGEVFYTASVSDDLGLLAQICVPGIELGEHGAGHPALNVYIWQVSFEIGFGNKESSK